MIERSQRRISIGLSHIPGQTGAAPRNTLMKLRQPPKATLKSAGLLLTFYLLVYFAGPTELPAAMQRFVGVVNAVLAMLVVLFADAELGGERLQLRVPFLPAQTVGRVAAGAVFLLVLAWWLSPWAPIAAMPTADRVPEQQAARPN